MKVFLTLSVCLLSFLFQSSSCAPRGDDPIVKWKGMNDANDLIFLYQKDVSFEQKQVFQDNFLYKSRSDGRGQDNRDGVTDILLGRIIDDYDGGIINFSEKSTQEQKDDLKKAIKESSLVYRVYENAVPNNIKVK